MSDVVYVSPPVFNPARWFWIAGDGRVYSSAAGKIIIAKDKTDWAAFQRFCAAASPTPWPRDDAGQETDEALNAVLTAHGLPLMPR